MNLSVFEWPPRDPRTREWIFIETWTPSLLLVSLYAFTVKVVLPLWMRGRNPFNVVQYIRAYNIFMVVANAWFLVKLGSRSYFGGSFNFICQGITGKTNTSTLEILALLNAYMVIRVIDFGDTFFFALRKKWVHVSTLHVTHHMIVVLMGVYALRYGADSQMLMSVIVNQSVHILMYSYYFLASFGTRFQKILSFKRYLTQLQLGQFALLFVHSSIVPAIWPCENLPAMHQLVILGPMTFFIFMFARFYLTSYLNKDGNLKGNEKQRSS